MQNVQSGVLILEIARPVGGTILLMYREVLIKKGVTQMSIMTKFRAANAKRAAYYRTVAEIEAMSIDTALDLGIYRGDAHRIAHEAVYGG